MQIFVGSVIPATARGSGWSAGTGVQRPSATDRAQEVHRPVQALSQQTPSTQKPDLHCWLVVQVTPLGRGPQLPLTQGLPITQSAFVLQVTVQASVVHR
jgi:hypothetical protein